MSRRKPADLYILGVGIRGLDQMTAETQKVLKRCRVVFDLTHQHRSIKKLNGNTRNLEPIYWTGEGFDVVYERIIRLVLDEASRAPSVATLTYGHPLVYDWIATELVRRSRRRHLKCQILPAISCLDTLCIDLSVHLGDGLQVVDADDLVDRLLTLNPRMDTFIMQLGAFRCAATNGEPMWQRGHFLPLVHHLCRFYSPSQRAVLAFSDDGVAGKNLVRTTISRLDTHRRKIFPGVTLYIPRVVTN